MTKKVNPAIVIAAVLAILTNGCRSTEEYQRLAKAGKTYTTAMDSLLTTAGQIRIDANSEQLLKDDAGQNQSIDDYNELSILDVRRLEILENLREHNRLLARYFNLLDELATSDAPEKAQKEIEGVVGNLNKIGTELRGSNIIANTGIIPSVTGLIVSSQIRGALREELDKRKDIIDLEFKTQQILLDELSKSIQQDVNLTIQSRELRLIIRPLVAEAPIANADAWVANRRMILTMNTTVSQLEDASTATGEFGEVFRDFVEGKLNRERLNTLLTDIESFLTVIEQLKK